MASIPVRPVVSAAPAVRAPVAVRRPTAALIPAAPPPRVVVAPPVPEPPPGLTVLGLLSCVRRRWKRAAFIGLTCAAGIACLVWMFLPPAKPYASTKLFFQKPPSSVNHPDPPVNQATQKELIVSRVVLAAALKDEKVASLPIVAEKGDPQSWLINDLEVDFPTNSEIMRITLREDRADEAKLVVEAIAQAYMTMIGNEAIENRRVHKEKLEAMLKAAREDFDSDPEGQRVDATGTTGLVSAEVILQSQRLINNEITQAKAEASRLNEQIAALRKEEAAIAKRLEEKPIRMTEAEFGKAVVGNNAIIRLKEQRDKVQDEYDANAPGLGPDNPRMVNIKARLDAAEARLEKEKETLKKAHAAEFAEKLADDLKKKGDEIAKLTADEKDKQRAILAKQGELDVLKASNTRIGKAKPALTAKSERVRDLTEKLGKLESEMTAPLAVRTIDGEAVIVRPHDASRRMKMSTLAAIAAFGLAFLAVGFLEFRANRLASATDVPQALGLKIMGTVPTRPRGAAVGMDEHEWDAVINEAVDSARTVFLHSASVQNLRTVMVTSAVGGEGKTSLTASLADSLARSGRRTLVIDADMRNPSLHGHFGVAEGAGLAEVMRGERPTTSVIVPTRRDNLWLMPAGRCDARALQALAQDEFSRVLAEIGNGGYDFILIDTCPVLPVADALLIARHADGVLMSLLVDYSQVDRVNAACQKLAAVDVPLLGAVVNGTRGDKFEYGYGYSPDHRIASRA